MTFGEKLKGLRKEKGYSQEELAGLLEVSRQAVSIVNDITNFCFRLLQEPYTAAPAMPKTKFLMSLTISHSPEFSGFSAQTTLYTTSRSLSTIDLLFIPQVNTCAITTHSPAEIPTKIISACTNAPAEKLNPGCAPTL